MKTYIENRKILYIDDEEEILKSFKSLLRKENYQIITHSESSKINDILNAEGPFALILSDQRMPNYDGVKVLESCRIKSPDTIRVLVTGYADYKDTIRAINVGGINSYISKPWDDEDIKRKISQWIEQYNLKLENHFLLQILDQENEKLNELLEGTVAQTVKVLGDIASHVSPQAALYAESVKKLGNSILQNMTGISAQERWEIMRALDLFNLGITLLPVAVQAEINKSGLSAIDNLSVAKNHHLLASGLLKNIPRFEPVARIIELQLKDFNGDGEPKSDNIKGSQIPLGARLLRIILDVVKSNDEDSDLNFLLSKMENNSRKYDAGLIRTIKEIVAANPLVSGEVFLPIKDLKPGMLLMADITTQDGKHLLLKSGSFLTETFINILIQWQKRDPVEEPVKVKIA